MAVREFHIYIGGSLSDGKINGFSLDFTNTDFQALSDVRSATIDGQKLQVDELYMTFRTRRETAGNVDYRALTGRSRYEIWTHWLTRLAAIPYGTPVWYAQGRPGKFDSIRKFYWKRPEREQGTSGMFVDATAQSDIGILDGVYSDGGIYSGTALADILKELIGDIIPYKVDEEIAQLPVYGWLPAHSDGNRQTVRNHIHTLVLSLGIAVLRDAGQNLYFTVFPTEAKKLPDHLIFQGMSAPLGENISRVEVMEYQFIQTDTDEIVTLFDNTASGNAASHEKILFDHAPVYDLQASRGLTVELPHCNYAIVSGMGTLTGKKYTMISRVVTADGNINTEADNIASVSGVYLINPLNSASVAKRLATIYNQTAAISMDIVRRGESPGDLVSFADIYGNPRTGYITNMDCTVTSFERAQCQVATADSAAWNRVRVLRGNTYVWSYALTGAGVWTVPDEMDGLPVRVVMISGGQGGASGVHGEDDVASGGNPGVPGKGGFLRVEDIEVHAGETYIFFCGKGGSGGIPTDEIDHERDKNDEPILTDDGSYKSTFYISMPGNAGVPTRFGALSSGSGVSESIGYRDFFTGNWYAQSGPDNGTAGGESGPSAGDVSQALKENDFIDTRFEDPGRIYIEYLGRIYYSGDYGAGEWRWGSYENGKWTIYGFGGAGGGAAAGANGKNGGDTTGSGEYIRGGPGGDGADAQAVFPADTRAPGTGGSGGHGGGAGGLGGEWKLTDGNHVRSGNGERGKGGAGSPGQRGADGGIILYTKPRLSDTQFRFFAKKSIYGQSVTFSDGVDGLPLIDLSVTIAPALSGTDALTLRHSNDKNNETAYSIPFEIDGNSMTVYGGIFDILNGILTVTHGHISAYGDEDLPDGWIANETTEITVGDETKVVPAEGAEVIYPLDRAVMYQFPTREIKTLYGVNQFTSDAGNIKLVYYADS